MPSSIRGTLPLPVRRILKKLGSDIRDARLSRRIRASTMAERALISRTTLHKIERGDAGVSMGMYATVLFVLGMHDGISDLADRSRDGIGLDLLEERLPQRVRVPSAARRRGKTRLPGAAGKAVSEWREVAARLGGSRRKIDRMESAFGHEDLARARRLGAP